MSDSSQNDKDELTGLPTSGQLSESPDDAQGAPVHQGELIESGQATADAGLGPDSDEIAAIVPTVHKVFDEEDLGDGYYEEVVGKQRGPVSRVVNRWFDRLAGAASDRSFANQEEEYESGRTKRDYVLNTVGSSAWGAVFPVLTVVVTQLAGVDQAGIFSLAFVTATLLMIVGNYGVRTFQVSDVSEDHSFAEYQIHRVFTCILMLVAGYAYCSLRGYADDMITINMGVYVYRMVDALADVYEGRLQQADKMYLGGLSQGLRSVVVLILFSMALLVTGSLPIACVVMAIAALASFFVVTLPLALMETPRSGSWSIKGIAGLFKLCTPLFVALFMYSLIDNMPKFLMEGALGYENQLYFNVMYFSAQGILMTTQMIYKPLLLRIANAWDNPEERGTFNKIIIGVFAVIVVQVIANLVIMGWIGIPIMSFLYSVDFEQFRVLVYLMIVAGGVTAAIDFLYQVITVQRKQNSVMKLYLITCVASVLLVLFFINTLGLMGAVIAYLAQMLILLVLIICQLANIRIRITRETNPDGVGQSWG